MHDRIVINKDILDSDLVGLDLTFFNCHDFDQIDLHETELNGPLGGDV